MVCVEIDVNGYVVESVDQTQPCIDLVLTTSTHLDRLTYWADIAIALEPGGAAFLALAGAMMLSAGSVLAGRMLYDYLRTSTQEA